jgi:histidinol-phosphate phosphatase family protein
MTISHAWPNLKIGHITDLHARHFAPGSSPVNSRRSRLMLDLFQKALEVFRNEKVDFIAVTGDLLDVPEFILTPSDYYDHQPAPWLQFTRRDYQLFKDLLDKTAIPYMLVPGNHDHEPILWQVFDRAQNTLDLPTASGDPCRVYRFCDREWAGHIPRRLDRERVLFDTALSSGPQHQIHLQHYVVTPSLNKGYPHTYFESDWLVKRISDSGKNIFSLSGHYHKGTEILPHANALITTGPAFTQFPHPIRIYQTGPQGITHQTLNLLDKPAESGKKVVFLDRDGVINTLPSYRTGPQAMALIPGSANAILRLKQAGYAVVVVTNQSAIGAGFVLDETVRAVNDKMCRLLVEESGSISAQPDAIYLEQNAGSDAIHLTMSDAARAKPSPAMLLEAAALLNLSLQGGFIVGDSHVDIQAGRAANLTTLLVNTGHGPKTLAHFKSNNDLQGIQTAENLAQAVDFILSARA